MQPPPEPKGSTVDEAEDERQKSHVVLRLPDAAVSPQRLKLYCILFLFFPFALPKRYCRHRGETRCRV